MVRFDALLPGLAKNPFLCCHASKLAASLSSGLQTGTEFLHVECVASRTQDG